MNIKQKIRLRNACALIFLLLLTACSNAQNPPPAPWWPTEVHRPGKTQPDPAVPTAAATTAPSPTEAPTTAPTWIVEPTSSNKSTTLTMWIDGDETYTSTVRAAADLYTSQHPNVNFEIETIPYLEAHDKFLISAAAGTTPDMLVGPPAWMTELGQLGAMHDFVGQYPDLLQSAKANTIPQVWDWISTPQGAVYSLPISLDFKVLYYRPDILEEAVGSPEPPRTWDELVDTIKKLKTSGNNGLVMQWGNAGWVGFADFLHQAGGSLYNSDCTQAAISSSEGLEALRFYADLYQKYGASTDIWPDLENSLASGDAALGITGSWQLGLMDSLHPEIAGLWAAAPLPAGPSGDPTTLMMGAVIGLTTTSPNPAVAADFLGSLFTQESMAARITQARSVNYPLIPPGIAYTDLLPLPVERIQVIKDGLKAAKGTPNCPGWEETANIVDQQIQNVIINHQDPQAALDAAALAMNGALK